MSAPVEHGHYWIFDEQQLDEALAAFVASHAVDASEAHGMRDVITWFLHSDECIERGMRRGGDD